MAVGFTVKHYWYQIGSGDFLNSFFSTISYHLEPNGWGTRYPIIMNKLYSEKISNEDITEAIKEVEEIRRKLADYEPSKIIWDIEDLSKQPPWGNDISPTITDMSNYFVTSGGDDLFQVLLNALNKAQSLKVDLSIESL